MEQIPEDPQAWLEQAHQDLSAIQAERAKVNKAHEDLLTDILQVRYAMASVAINKVNERDEE